MRQKFFDGKTGKEIGHDDTGSVVHRDGRLRKHTDGSCGTMNGSMSSYSNQDGHPGFKAVEGKIAAKEGIPKKNAGAILASASRKASPAAKKKNPFLKKVK